MKSVDIVTTATIRPEILEKTLFTFSRNIFVDKRRYNFIINVDPVGDKTKVVDDVINIAKKYFRNITYNTPKEPGFTKAVIWLWSHTSSDYVFHLEDDWLLKYKVNIDDMIYILDKYPKICSVRLSKGGIHAGRRIVREYPCEYIKDGDAGKFRLCPRVSLNPTLFRGKFVKEAIEVMTTELNPESQLVSGHAKKKEDKKGLKYNSDAIEELLERWDHSVLRVNGGKPIIRDIGTRWRSRHRIKRTYDFMHWGKINKISSTKKNT